MSIKTVRLSSITVCQLGSYFRISDAVRGCRFIRAAPARGHCHFLTSFRGDNFFFRGLLRGQTCRALVENRGEVAF